MEGIIQNLYHYPIKGLSAQSLARVELRKGEGFPFDRVFGFARHDSGFDVKDPRPLPKDRFIVLVKEERLAGLDTTFDPVNRHLRIEIANNNALEADLSTEDGIAQAVHFFSTMFDLGEGERPIFASSGIHRFTDVSVLSAEMMNAVSLINLESVRDFAKRIGRPVDPMRFRANIYFDGWPPFSELDLVDKELAIGDARLKIVMRTRRCAATEVDPATSRRDIAVPRLLMSTYGHPDMGVTRKSSAMASSVPVTSSVTRIVCKSMIENKLSVLISKRAMLTPDICEFELRRPDGDSLPAFTAGAHISVDTPAGVTRSYSLVNDDVKTDRYVIAVKRETSGRGGSLSMHTQTVRGDILRISAPSNAFVLKDAPSYLLLAGGIGLTPILAMLKRLRRDRRRPFLLVYSTQSAELTPYLDELTAPDLRDNVIIHHDSAHGGFFDHWPFLRVPGGRHTYFLRTSTHDGFNLRADDPLAAFGHPL